MSKLKNKNMSTNNQSTDDISSEDKSQKIQSLRDMINNAERTIHSAKAMLLQIEGKKRVGRRKKSDEDGNVVHGTFDGQVMIGTNGKQYPVPVNYASKSKLVEGDLLKLTIGNDGAFMYKQVGPAPRQNKIGVISQDENGNYFIIADNNSYKVLLASVTYFHANPGDQVAIITSVEEDAKWATIESVLQQADENVLNASQKNINQKPAVSKKTITTEDSTFSLDNQKSDELKSVTKILTSDKDSALPTEEFLDAEAGVGIEDKKDADQNDDSTKPTATKKEDVSTIVDEWIPNIEEIEKEIKAEMDATKTEV
jgi:hypothetical protein